MTSNPAQKELKVKSGVVKRLAKELAAYKKEYEHQQSRIDKMKAENADSYDIKKQVYAPISRSKMSSSYDDAQVEVLGETEMMIPNCKKRLEAAYNDLQLFLVYVSI